jgi:hypothetical protein
MGTCLLERSCRLIWLISEALFEAFLKVATIKKTPVLKREELYRGLIEPGWGAGLLNPAQGGEQERSTTNITYKTSPALKSFLSVAARNANTPGPQSSPLDP